MIMTISCPECGKKIMARTMRQAYKLAKAGYHCERCQNEHNG